MRCPLRRLLATLLACGLAGAHAQSGPRPELPLATGTDRLIIKYRSGSAGASRSDFNALARSHDAANRRGVQMTALRRNGFNAQVMAMDRALDHASARSLAAEIMAADPDVEYAEPDLILRTQAVPNDVGFSAQWNLHEAAAGLNLPAAWNLATGAGVVVAVVDTGYRPHADLAANIVGGHDFVSTTLVGNDGNGRDTSALDPGDANAAGECGAGSAATTSSWHGTHVAGTVAAVTHNGIGVAGVAFGAKVLPVRALGKCGGYTSDIADGVVWAAGGSVSGVPANAHPARVINLSLGGSGSCGTTMQNAIKTARSLGAVVVVAAGNSAANAGAYTPASCQGVTTVAAVDRSGARAHYSNHGSVVDLAAPGGDTRSGSAGGILSTLNSGTAAPAADSYGAYQGTSMATPHVAGVAALMLSANPALAVEQVENLLRSSARAFPSGCSGCGAGLADAHAAVTAARATAALSLVSLVETTAANDTPATAQTLGVDAALLGAALASATDVDHYRVTVPVGRTLTAVLTPASGLDLTLTLMTSGGSVLASSSSGGSGTAERVLLSNHGSSAATWVLRVAAARRGSGGYTLRVTQ